MQDTSSQMTLATLIGNYARYNAWANETLVEWLKTKPAGTMDAEVASSFPSIKRTLIHIWDTERYWLSVVRQTPPVTLPDALGLLMAEVFSGVVATSGRLARYVDTLSPEALQEACEFTTPWVQGIRPKAEFIHHALNHSTYHRGQIITIGRNLGFTDAPMTDYNFYNFKDELAWAG
jgi:uncharacterized damage-inducible protein DinB